LIDTFQSGDLFLKPRGHLPCQVYFKKLKLVFIFNTYSLSVFSKKAILLFLFKAHDRTHPLIKLFFHPVVLLLFIATVSVFAKTSGVKSSASSVFAGKTTGADVAQAVAAFEAALTPYFQMRAHLPAKPGGTAVALTDADLFAIAKHWDQLSPSFKALYLKATDIPSDMIQYVSPSGHFEIYYYTSGPSAVDVTDTIGYSTSDWRTKTHAPNGIPDYVDEVAYAADSAWSMEIAGFGFVNPLPSIDAPWSSSRYKISLQLDGLDGDVYAYTYPRDLPTPGNTGIRSYIQLRPEWNEPGWSKNHLDYTMHPEKAVRVTCCHEFFHGVQYSMARSNTYLGDGVNQWLDHFPVTFLEASAVLMEDLGFDYVNDYFQYANDFLNNPFATTLQDTSSPYDDVYKNGLATMYLFQFAYPSPRIDFIKNLLFNNYHQFTKFYNNLILASGQAGRTWADLLGSFYTGSYYTADRAVPGRFIKDAPLLDAKWYYPPDVVDKSFSVSKTVQLFGMNTFSYTYHTGGSGALNMLFTGDPPDAGDADTNAVWSVHCILKKDTVPAHDSIIIAQDLSATRANIVINAWQNYTEALVIATNARYDHARQATVVFLPCGVTFHKGDSAFFSSAPAGTPLAPPYANVSVKAVNDLSCSLSLAAASMVSPLADSARSDSLVPAGALYDISFPLTWSNDASMQLSVAESRQTVESIAASRSISDSLFDVCRWDDKARSWKRCGSRLVTGLPNDSLKYSRLCPLSIPGIYGLFGLLPNADRDLISGTFVAFPNPARIKKDGLIRFQGRNILEVWIYSINGTLISHAVKGENGQTQSFSENPKYYSLDWKLRSTSGATVSPGVYYARVGFKNEQTRGMTKKLQKIFVLP
jgi:hypothetical protein